jgi:hypothetical protein
MSRTTEPKQRTGRAQRAQPPRRSPWGRPSAGHHAIALHETRRFEEAITACQDAAAIFQETGDRHGEGIAVENLEAARAAQIR